MFTPEKPKGIMDWLKESPTAKAFFIGALILVLLIPSTLVQELIYERMERQDEVAKEISESWSEKQLIKGPVLVIPYKKMERFIDDTKKEAYREVTDNLYVLPDKLNYDATIKPEIRHRGIFKVVVYSSQIKVDGSFAALNLAALGIKPEQLMLNQAGLTFEISDLKGLKNSPVIKAAGQSLSPEPVLSNSALFSNGLQAPLNLSNTNNGKFDFSFNLNVNGSEQLHFLHLGKTTAVKVNSTWATPSFDGRYLPDDQHVDEKGFSAGWQRLYYNRPFPQQWVADQAMFSSKTKTSEAAFGVTLRLPVDDYQKTMRTSKYAILIILLTFISLFITEVVGKKPVHAFNYMLIGAAMVIYYTLLLSFAEQIGFNAAYGVASVATIALIASFIASLLKQGKAAALFSAVLAVFYGFIFVIIQLEDLALLVGSIALFVIVALLMYISRKVNWNSN